MRPENYRWRTPDITGKNALESSNLQKIIPAALTAPESSATFWGARRSRSLLPCFSHSSSVGGTPPAAVGTTALPGLKSFHLFGQVLILSLRIGVIASLLFAGVWMASGEQASVAPEMQGRWAGNARIEVSWCRQTNLPVALDIQPDGTVAGKVGDARLRSGWIKPNRGLLNHAFTPRSDYIVHGMSKGRLSPRKTSRARVFPFRSTSRTERSWGAWRRAAPWWATRITYGSARLLYN